MPLPVKHGPAADVIEGHEPSRGWVWRDRAAALVQRHVRLLLFGGCLSVVLVGGLALPLAQDDPSQRSQGATEVAVVDASGEMVLRLGGSAATDRLDGTATWEDEDRWLSGPIELRLPHRHLSGFAELELWFTVPLGSEAGLWTSHASGTVHARFEWTTCDGPVAGSLGREPLQTRGSMSLRCDDGSLFAAELRKKRYLDRTDNHAYLLFLALEEGSYVAGPSA